MMYSTASAIREFVSRMSESSSVQDYRMCCHVEPCAEVIQKDTPCHVYLYCSRPNLSAYGLLWNFAKSLEGLGELDMCEPFVVSGTRNVPWRTDEVDFLAVRIS